MEWQSQQLHSYHKTTGRSPVQKTSHEVTVTESDKVELDLEFSCKVNQRLTLVVSSAVPVIGEKKENRSGCLKLLSSN